MKRAEFLRYLRRNGCEYCGKGVGIHGGPILGRTNVRRFRGTPKSMTTWSVRYAKTLEFPASNKL